MKRVLQVSTGDLLKVVDAYSLLITKQTKAHYLGMDEDRLRPQIRHQLPLFALVLPKITNFALGKVYEQLSLLEKEKQDRVETVCKHIFTTTMGMPCLHVLRQRDQMGEILMPEDFHRQWVCCFLYSFTC